MYDPQYQAYDNKVPRHMKKQWNRTESLQADLDFIQQAMSSPQDFVEQCDKLRSVC